MLNAVTKRTCTSSGRIVLPRPLPSREIRAKVLRALRQDGRRAAIEEFVQDIPLEPGHPSARP